MQKPRGEGSEHTVLHHVYYIPMYSVHPSFWPKLSGKKTFYFLDIYIYKNIYLSIYLFLETKPMIIFQGIILHMDIITAL